MDRVLCRRQVAVRRRWCGEVQNREGSLASGVHQSSILGPLLFAMYVSDRAGGRHCWHSTSSVRGRPDALLRPYRVTARRPVTTTPPVRCSDTVSLRFHQNVLLLNPSKTFATRQRLVGVDISHSIKVASADIQFSEAVKLLGVTLDTSLSFDQHVTNVVRACNFHRRSLRRLRPSLTFESAKSMATAIIGARTDYCNSLLYGTTERNLNRLQKVQNATARIVHQASFHTSATAPRQQLHWLPIRQRIAYKLATLTFKAKYCRTPLYLHEQLRDHQVTRTLRSITAQLFYRPFVFTVFASRAFYYTLHLKFGTVSGHPQDRRTLSVVLGVA